MNCPVCNDVRMREVEKDHVLIDICPDCKGVWLDRGELEKITQGLREDKDYYDRSFGSNDRYEHSKKNEQKNYDSKHNNNYPPKQKKKKSMMDIFSDFL